MLWVYYLLPCTPFFKFSILSLQIQAGIKCSIPRYRGFSNWKLNINQKDFSSLPLTTFPFTKVMDVVKAQQKYNYSIDALETLSGVNLMSAYDDKLVTSAEIMPLPAFKIGPGNGPDKNLPPPEAPPGYVLYQECMKLKPSAWLPGDRFPTFHVIDGFRYAREEDLMHPAESNKGSRLYICPTEKNAPLEIVIHQALIRQYVYTGNREEDLYALRIYLDRFELALRTLEAHVSVQEKHTDRWDARQHIRIARDSLKEEIRIVKREPNDPDEDQDGYTGFDEFDMGMPALPRRRPKGHMWVCKI